MEKKCLTSACTESNKGFLYGYDGVWSNIIEKIKKEKDSPVVSFDKSILTINFDTEDDDIPLNKMLKFNSLIIFNCPCF